MRICGVDLGKRRSAVTQLVYDPDAVLEDGRSHELLSVNAFLVHPTARGQELAQLMAMTMHAIGQSERVFIEEPLVGRGVKASMEISQVAGALMSMCAEQGIITHLVNVKTWKSAIVGNGNAGKPDVRMWLQSEHSHYAERCGEDQDCIDATCVALYGVHVLDTAAELSTPGEAADA